MFCLEGRNRVGAGEVSRVESKGRICVVLGVKVTKIRFDWVANVEWRIGSLDS